MAWHLIYNYAPAKGIWDNEISIYIKTTAVGHPRSGGCLFLQSDKSHQGVIDLRDGAEGAGGKVPLICGDIPVFALLPAEYRFGLRQVDRLTGGDGLNVGAGAVDQISIPNIPRHKTQQRQIMHPRLGRNIPIGNPDEPGIHKEMELLFPGLPCGVYFRGQVDGRNCGLMIGGADVLADPAEQVSGCFRIVVAGQTTGNKDPIGGDGAVLDADAACLICRLLGKGTEVLIGQNLLRAQRIQGSAGVGINIGGHGLNSPKQL